MKKLFIKDSSAKNSIKTSNENINNSSQITNITMSKKDENLSQTTETLSPKRKGFFSPVVSSMKKLFIKDSSAKNSVKTSSENINNPSQMTDVTMSKKDENLSQTTENPSLKRKGFFSPVVSSMKKLFTPDSGIKNSITPSNQTTNKNIDNLSQATDITMNKEDGNLSQTTENTSPKKKGFLTPIVSSMKKLFTPDSAIRNSVSTSDKTIKENAQKNEIIVNEDLDVPSQITDLTMNKKKSSTTNLEKEEQTPVTQPSLSLSPVDPISLEDSSPKIPQKDPNKNDMPNAPQYLKKEQKPLSTLDTDSLDSSLFDNLDELDLSDENFEAFMEELDSYIENQGYAFSEDDAEDLLDNIDSIVDNLNETQSDVESIHALLDENEDLSELLAEIEVDSL